MNEKINGVEMTISIFGLGYVGCVSLGCLAQNGFKVIGIDVQKSKVDLINRGIATIVEKDIDTIVREQFEKSMLSATVEYYDAVQNSDVSIICVGTPSTESGSLNLEYIYKTAHQIGEALKDKTSYHVVVIRSTVLPGTNNKVGQILAESSGKLRGLDFDVVSNPEFLREGTAVEDYYNPPFTLIGTDSDQAARIMGEIYAKVNGDFIRTEIKAAELIKYVNNSYHALKVTFANEIGNVCKQLEIDSHEVMRLFCLDKQLNISNYYFKPGFAYGGSCLPKDLRALKTLSQSKNLEAPVLSSIEQSNSYQISLATRMIENTGNNKIGILGVAFKQGTDDLRYSPMVYVIDELVKKGYEIKLFDDYVQEAFLIGANREFIEHHMSHLPQLLCSTMEEVVMWADTVVFNRKSTVFENYVLQFPNKKFIDLARTVQDISLPNYEGICW
jgi:GDP-mannose 6-dehydrogenase